MIKFKGKPHELKMFILYLMHIYGEDATIKEVMQDMRKEIKIC
jgi:hypothetical protein